MLIGMTNANDIGNCYD